MKLPLLLLLLASLLFANTWAHERRTVLGGDYTMIVGFLAEPTFTYQLSGVSLNVYRTNDTIGITGLDSELNVTVSHPTSGKSS